MLLKSAGDGEGHITEGTTEPVHARLAMGLHVPGQLAALGARVRAKLTLVRLLAGVAPLVHRQVAAGLENFYTPLEALETLEALLLDDQVSKCIAHHYGD